MSKIIGIDLGTTNSVVAVMEGGEPVVLRILKAAVSRLRSWASRSPSAWWGRSPSARPSPIENTVFSIKRFMGRKFDEVSEEMKMVPYP